MRRMVSLAVLLILPSVCLSQPPVADSPAPDLGGKWSGYWVSDKNGHHGPLNAKFQPKDYDTYRMTFSGRFAKVIPFRYSTTMDVVGTGDGVVIISTEKRL